MAQRRPGIAHSASRRGAARPVSWEEALRRYQLHLVTAVEASPLTLKRYQWSLDHFAAWWRSRPGVEDLAPAAILASDLRDYRDALRQERLWPGTARERPRKAAAINTLLAPLRAFLLWCREAGMLAEPPDFPRRVKAQPPGRQALAPADQRRLLRALEQGRSRRDLALVLVLLDAGLRVAELCALKWRDICLVRGRAELAIWHGKGDKQAAVPLSTRCRRALLELQQADAPGGDDPVFRSRKGGRGLTPRGVQDLLARYARRGGCAARVHPHQLRHTCASDMLSRGHQIPVVQAVLRHASYHTTMQYLHTTAEQIRAAVERERDEPEDEP